MHEFSGLESRLQLCRICFSRQKMLLWKFYRITWTVHANVDAPAPSWVVHPARIMSLHTRLTELTPVMVHALRKQTDVTIDSITRTVVWSRLYWYATLALVQRSGINHMVNSGPQQVGPMLK